MKPVAKIPLFFVALLLTAPLAVRAQEPAQEGAGQERSTERPERRESRPEIKPYDKVITSEAVSDTGIFTVHRIKDKYYYEIPKSEQGKEFLWVSQIARTTAGAGYGGQSLGNRVVKWERHGDRILLRSISYELVADRSLPIRRAVQAANNDTIIRVFNIEALGADESAVIDVTRLFTTDVTEFSARTRLRARGMDASRSFIERIVSFPENIEVETTHTYTSPADTPGSSSAPGPPSPLVGTGMRPGSATVVLHYSMIRLPEKPMMPRLYDKRVGYFTVRQLDYGQDEHRAPQRAYITRWRLEKKDPQGALSEPVKPIVFWVDPATPEKWVPYVKSGIEAWQSAFEEAGFKNAILAREAPSPEEDPDWSPEDARYSVIRWLPSTVENAMGPHIHDPRSGEILEADIQMHHNVMNLVRNWYFVQAGPLDKRTRKLPLPDDLMGKLIEYVVSHEVGHSLGFQHNMKASSTYPAEKVRDPEWVKKMGHTPTLMDYSRFNYVAQPEDGIPPQDLIPKIGPYDRWATMWGYKLIPEAQTPDEEKPALDRWAREQDTTPWYRFSTVQSRGVDPGELTEAVGDADAIQSTAQGLKNLERVSAMLLEASSRPGEPYDDLEELYGRMLGQWVLELNHVGALVGGFHSQQKHAGQDGVLFTPVPKERQAAAVRFLNQHAFSVPAFAVNPEVLRRIEATGVLDRLKSAQQRLLSSLFNSSRINRLVEQEAIDGPASYAPTQFVADVRRGIWSELQAESVQINPYRRNLQRSYLELLNDKLNGPQAVNDEQRALFRGELRSLSLMTNRALPRADDRITRLHLEDVRDQIQRILDPRFVRSVASGTPARRFGGDLDPFEDPEAFGCWPDYQFE